MKQPKILAPGLDTTEVHRRAACYFRQSVGNRPLSTPVLQASLIDAVHTFNQEVLGPDRTFVAEDRQWLIEATTELETDMRAASELGIAVRTDASSITHHDRLFAEYGVSGTIEGIDVLRFTEGAVTAVDVEPRHSMHDDTYDPSIFLRVRSEQDPALSVRGEDGEFHDSLSPGRWYRFPLESVLVVGFEPSTAGQQI